MSASNTIGYEWFKKLIENDLKNDSDHIVAMAHFGLIKLGAFRCLGIGDEKTLADNEETNSSELLPQNWNDNSSSYSMRYVYNGDVYILLGTVANDTIILNLLSGTSLEVANTAFNITETVRTVNAHPTSAPELNSIMERLKRELLDPVTTASSKTRTSETQTATPTRTTTGCDPLPNYILPNATPDVLRVQLRPIDPLREIGRGDLDPLGRGGGGMLFNPDMRFQPQLPRGPGGPQAPSRNPNAGIVPGARFDPFGPPEPGRIGRMSPDNDHFPPPGYDDMFM